MCFFWGAVDIALQKKESVISVCHDPGGVVFEKVRATTIRRSSMLFDTIEPAACPSIRFRI